MPVTSVDLDLVGARSARSTLEPYPQLSQTLKGTQLADALAEVLAENPCCRTRHVTCIIIAASCRLAARRRRSCARLTVSCVVKESPTPSASLLAIGFVLESRAWLFAFTNRPLERRRRRMEPRALTRAPEELLVAAA